MGFRNRTTHRRSPSRDREDEVPTLIVLYVPHRLPTGPDRILEAGETPLGRDVALHEGVRLDDACASRLHATVTRRGATVTVQDRSTNGTLRNGEKVEAATLEDGDLLRLGDSLVLFRVQPTSGQDAEVAGLDGRAPSLRALRARVARVAPSDASILVLGESGTGKELIARAVHAGSGRRGPFVPVNCSAIPRELAESQLFGHVAGSFTGASKAHDGFFRAANGGTLFLDEIGDLPLDLQPKLLRALEEGEVLPVGATRPIPVDVRVVAATHRDLHGRVEAEEFRGDLLARLEEIPLETPSLRDRREDILPTFVAALGEGAAELEPDLAEALVLHEWPYNVRELLKVAKELRVLGPDGERYTLAQVRRRLARPTASPPAGEATPDVTVPPTRPVDVEGPPDREQMVALLEEHAGEVAAIARALGRSRRQVYRYLDQMGLDVDDYRAG